MAAANHFPYFHFLQPNRYVAGSKPLNLEERDMTSEEESEKFKAIAYVYPKLEERIPSLRAEGFNVYSLVDIFKNTKETVYSDSCCHFNMWASDKIAQAIGEQIVHSYKQPTTAGQSH